MIKPAHWSLLEDRHERDEARIAHVARCNTIVGGASALVKAKRLKAMGGADLTGVVADVYAASTGKPSEIHDAWECPECDRAHLGQQAALRCCKEEDLCPQVRYRR